MGVKATVVYDIKLHKTLILHTSDVAMTARYEVIDTIASFSQHCESLRGIARTAAEVSSAWGGPPYISYAVVASRFRTIVIWEEDEEDLDLAYDVHHCFSRLQKSVSGVASQLEEGKVEAVAKVYNEAWYALRGEFPMDLQDGPPSSEKPPSRPKLLPKSPSLSRRSSFADPKKKKSGGGKFFGRISSAIKNAGGSKDGSDTSSVAQGKVAPLRRQSESSLRAPSESAAASVAMYGSEAGLPFDDEVGELEVPEAVFEWANFGGEVQDESGDLTWFINLMHRDDGNKKRPRPATLRPGSTPSTPLTIPSVASPLSQGTGSVQSSIDKNGSVPLPLPAPSGIAGAASPPTPTSGSSAQQHPGPSKKLAASQEQTAKPAPDQSRKQPTQAIPSVITQQGSEILPPTAFAVPSGAAKFAQGSHVLQSPVPGMSQPQQLLGSVNQVGISTPVMQGAPMQALPVQGQPMQQMNVPQVLPQQGMGGGIGAQPAVSQEQRQGRSTPTGGMSVPSGPPSFGSSQASVPTAKTPATGRSTPQMKTSSVGSNIPPALAAQMQADKDFDISTLGGYKDDAAAPVSGHSLGSGVGGGPSSGTSISNQDKDDEAIRGRMNEFAVTMQAGNFTLALRQVLATLKLLRKVQPRRERETITCANYVLAQKILIRNTTLESEVPRFPSGSAEAVRRHVEMALLTMFLAELKHLLPRHRVAAMKVAIEKNIVVGNYGMCARWLRVLIEKAPAAQKAEFEQRLQVCVQHGEQNAQMPMTNRLCYITLQVLTSPYGKCETCSAVYHPQMAGVAAGQVCPTCFVGAVEAKMR